MPAVSHLERRSRDLLPRIGFDDFRCVDKLVNRTAFVQVLTVGLNPGVIVATTRADWVQPTRIIIGAGIAFSDGRLK